MKSVLKDAESWSCLKANACSPREMHTSSGEFQERRHGQAAAVEGSFWLAFGRSRRGCEAKGNRNKNESRPEEVPSTGGKSPNRHS